MPLPSGADVSIGGQHLMLAKDQDDHYNHRFVPRPVTRNDIPGSPGDETLQPYFREWRQTDWSGGEVGELNSFFDPQDPTAYDTGLCNPRVPGQLTGPPTRTGATPTAAGGIPTFGPFLGVSNGFIWLLHERLIYSSSDAVTWTNRETITGGREVTCPPCSDGRYMYQHNSDTPGGVGTVHIRRYDVVNLTTETIVNIGPSARDSMGIAFLAGKLYRWTGTKLREYDISNFNPGDPAITSDTGTAKFQVGGDATGVNLPTVRFGGCIATDNSIAFFFATTGETIAYEFKNNVGAELVKFQNGFTCKAMCHYLSKLWFVGQSDGQGALFQYDLGTRQGSFVNYIRRTSGTAMDPVSVSPGPGDQVVIGCSAGEVFIYDIVLQSISMLDTRTGDGTLNAVATYGALRIAAMGKGSVTLKTSAWSADTASTTVSGNLTSSEWDYDLPEEATKTLIGFHVSFTPITGAETIVVKFGADGAAATTTTAGTINSATSGAATGNAFLPVSTGSSTTSFRTLRWQLSWTGGAVVKALTVRMYPIAKDELWDLLIDLRDFAAGAGEDAKRNWELQGILFGTAAGPNKATGILRANSVVTFRDGTPYPFGAGGTGDDFDTFTCVVERATNQAEEAPQGVGAVTLRNIAPSI